MERPEFDLDFNKWIDSYIGLDLTRMYALYLNCRGLSHKEIAMVLHKSNKTISRYIKTACLILGAKNKTEAFYLAGRDGIWDNFDPFDRNIRLKVGATGRVKE